MDCWKRADRYGGLEAQATRPSSLASTDTTNTHLLVGFYTSLCFYYSKCVVQLLLDRQHQCLLHNGQCQLNLHRWLGNVATAQGSPASCRCPSSSVPQVSLIGPIPCQSSQFSCSAFDFASPNLVTHQKPSLASPGITWQSFSWSPREKKNIQLPPFAVATGYTSHAKKLLWCHLLHESRIVK